MADIKRPGSMAALGLIETIGAVGGIEAADAALKAATVRLIGKEYADAGLHLIKLVGEVSSVRAAVDAGAAAAHRVGQLAGTHIIPRPDIQLEEWMFAPTGSPKALAFGRAPRIGMTPSGRDDDDGSTDDAPNGTPGVLPDDYLDLPVRELRAAVRSLADFPLQGRQVSTATREQLLDAIREWQALSPDKD